MSPIIVRLHWWAHVARYEGSLQRDHAGTAPDVVTRNICLAEARAWEQLADDLDHVRAKKAEKKET